MLSRIKDYAVAILAAIVGVLYLLLGKERAQKEAQEQVAKTYKSASEEAEETLRVIEHVEKSKSNVNQYSNDDVFSELRKYDRGRKDKDNL